MLSVSALFVVIIIFIPVSLCFTDNDFMPSTSGSDDEETIAVEEKEGEQDEVNKWIEKNWFS